MRARVALLVYLGACAGAAPEPCGEMCAAAVPVQQACLDGRGVDWPESIWGSQEGYVESCETWAWEHAVLSRDARRRGEDPGPSTSDVCTDRLELARADGTTCEAWEALGWGAPDAGP